ncbi:MAG: transposase, partial [Mycobacterium sp.]
MTTNTGSGHVVAGVDTHKLTHHGAVLDADTGKLLSEREFPATWAGYRRLLSWMRSHGTVLKAGLEGTGSYGAGLQRFLQAHDVTVIEVSRPNRQDRRRRGKSDPIDAINAARAVLSEAANSMPKCREGFVESVREIRATRRSAVKARRAALHQIHGLLWCAPDDLRATLSGYDRAALVARCARLRIPTNAALEDPTVTARKMLRRLAKRIQLLDEEIAEANHELESILTEHTPNLLAVNGVGTKAAGQMLTTAGQNIDRLKSEASLARLCGVARSRPAAEPPPAIVCTAAATATPTARSIWSSSTDCVGTNPPSNTWLAEPQKERPRRRSSAASNAPSSASSTEHFKPIYSDQRRR